MPQHPVELLTPRQRECLRLVGGGLVAKEIARELGLSPDTVAIHIKAGMGRLRVSSRREAGRMVVAFEAANPDRTSPVQVMAAHSDITEQAAPETDEAVPTRLEEVRTSFDYSGLDGPRLPARVQPALQTPWSRLLLTIGIAIAIGVLVLMAFPLSESFQRIADLVDPPTD